MTGFLNTVTHKILSADWPRTDWPHWLEWKIKWEAANDAATCLGLLHSGFRTNVYSPQDQEERLSFYLLLADGYWTTRSDRLAGHGVLARKAFSILAEHCKDERVLRKELLTLSPDTVRRLFRYFRPAEEREGCGLASFETPQRDGREISNHAVKVMNETLLDWCKYVWFKDYEFVSSYESHGPWPRNPATVQMLNRKRVEIINILHAYGNGQLEKLIDAVPVLDDPKAEDLKISHRVRWELFTPDCVVRLGNLAAAQPGCLVGGYSQGKFVDAALVNGSSAAKVYTLVVRAQEQLASKKK